MNDFETCFLAALANAPASIQRGAEPITQRFGRMEGEAVKLGRWRGRLRARRIAWAGRVVALKLGYSPSRIDSIDWSAIDWPKVIGLVVKWLLVLLPLLVL
jgi:hypothetical protein